ncbi:MAG: uroporphyrinogen decarboxylase family protein [Eubacteriales bacterium]|jgi:uroporphyrinogen decarboxylase|nr:uroporphyrinogen decarboxylase family protein [Eubacteriales bacterium]
MNSREKVKSIFQRRNTGSLAYWTGHPNGATLPLMAAEWHIPGDYEAVYNYLDDDCRWISCDSGYISPDGRGALDPSRGGFTRNTLAAGGCFSEIDSVAEVEKYPWPDPSDSDFTHIYKAIDNHADKMVFTGMWACFYHNMCDFFGMENYFMQMHENPAVVEAATERMVDYYVGMNDIFLRGLGDRADVVFFGNDFGTQLDLMISPEHFRKFILPSIKRITDGAKKYGKYVMLHSCGSIYRIIPDLIDAGIDALHPIQAQAAGMSAKDLAQYKNDLAFVGGIDAQSFFVNASPREIKDEVRRVGEILGPNIVISPSHEEILPNVPPANVLAMARAAKGNYS